MTPIGAAPTSATGLPDVFPDLDREETLERVRRAWKIVDGRFPLPRWRVRCPADKGPDGRYPLGDPHFGGHEVQLSRIQYARRKTPATLPGRADVVFKCCACSLCWTHGVPVPADVYGRATEDHGNTWRWREILDALGGREQLNLKRGRR